MDPTRDRRRAPGDRDLVEAIRAELAAIEPTRACCRAAERAGLGAAATGQARTPIVARLAVRLDDGAGRRTPAAFEWETARDHCRVAWLRGLFLARGSLSLGVGRCHLEFVVPLDEAPGLADHLASVSLPASWRIRRGRGVVTWKGTERVLDFLRRIGASGSVLELESRLVTRQLQGHLNRVLNAETSNLGRSVAAAARQLAAIRALEAADLLESRPPLERGVAALRVDQPEATLAELAAQLELSRPRVQRAFERLELAAQQASAGARMG